MADLSGGPIYYEDSRSWFRSSNWFRYNSPDGHKPKPENGPERFAEHREKFTDYQKRVHHHIGSRALTLINEWRIASSLKHACVFLGFSLPVIIFIIVIDAPRLYNYHSQYWNSKFNHCNFNGAFTPYDEPSISQWDTAGFLYITVAWGRMSFPLAKFIDVVWHNVAGRAVQAVLAWTTYTVSSQYLLMAMREAPVSYTTFEALAFVPPTFIRTLRLAGDLLMRRGVAARLITLWIVLSSVFVLSFSSWSAAMAGYSSITYAVMDTYDGELVAWENYQVVQFAIADAWRIGEPSIVLITTGRECVLDGFYNNDDEDVDEDEDESGEYDEPWKYVPVNCSIFWRTVEYVHNYGLHANQGTPSSFIIGDVQHNLSSPTLNITTSFDNSSLETLSGYLTDLAAHKHISRLGFVQDISPSTFWVYRNETYSWEYVLDHASCRYSKYHDWGFSFLILFITSLLLALWSIGTYALWLYVQLHDRRKDGHSDQGMFGIYNSSLALVYALRNDFGEEVLQPGMTESNIRSLLRRRGKTGIADIREPQVVSTTTAREQTALVRYPDLQASSHLTPPHSRTSKSAWETFKHLLWPRYPSAEHSLPYQSTTSSQAHIMRTSTIASSIKSSSLASTLSPSTTFNYSATIPASNPPSLGADLISPTSCISSRGGRPGFGVSNSTNRSYSYSSTLSQIDPSASERHRKASQVSSAPAEPAAAYQGLSQISGSSSTRTAPGKGLACNAFEFRNDLGDD
ncbi:uncharacterized protein A1O9_11478 [Exophiala aquamarina CBS 119918]|uniref:Uncharacterized protein n=1 Tax=Exophiala aquamarina CBS 119918 TaxID=1182545 RepID=A0A072PAL8_9EURO|nr:uncharacterized protein A1O9_11478 [Exophiala aquamarina CBS 119918]KEF52635.1 hypothetical protein A1O9_11478 [Exophiala aquamarina CBS 119918]